MGVGVGDRVGDRVGEVGGGERVEIHRGESGEKRSTGSGEDEVGVK